MTTLSGDFYDGKTSLRQAAGCRLTDGGEVVVMRIRDARILLRVPSLAAVQASPRLADTPRYLYFPGGAVFETDDNETVDRLFRQAGRNRWAALVHRLEHRKRHVLAAMAVLAGVVWAMGALGIPAAAKWIAFALPARVGAAAADQTLAALDAAVLQPSELDPAVRQRLMQAFSPITADRPDIAARIVFRKGGRLGANAFALPDGTVVFTDELVALAEDDRELMAVVAHEIGHVVHRHGLRRLIQDSLLAFALMAFTGDASGTSELFYGLPVMLTELAYSRDFEREADRHALDCLHSRHIDPAHFARLMRRMEPGPENRPGERPSRGWTGYLSTHPVTAERIATFEH